MKPSRPRHRLQLEALENRIVPATRFVVPLDLPVDNATTFNSVSSAFLTPGLTAGDVIQIEPGSPPGPLINGQISNLANLTVQGDPAFGLSELPEVALTNGITIGATRVGFTFNHLNLRVTGG